MAEISLTQNTSEWLAYRKRHIGASETPYIMGSSPYVTPYQLWVRKKGLIPDVEMTPAMQRGKDLEPIALAEFEEIHNIFMTPKVFVSEEYPWMMASMDGVSLCGKVAVEIKCPGKKNHELALSGKIPEEYIYQLQHQMIVLKLDSMLYFSFDGQKGVTLVAKKDPVLAEKCIFHTHAFWQSILNDEPPELCERDYTQKIDNDWAIVANRRKQIRSKIKELQKEEEDCDNTLIHMANKQNAEGAGIRVQAYYRKGRVDYNKVPELIGVDLEPYRKPATQVFSITECK